MSALSLIWLIDRATLWSPPATTKAVRDARHDWFCSQQRADWLNAWIVQLEAPCTTG
jgi:hypothetical protein